MGVRRSSAIAVVRTLTRRPAATGKDIEVMGIDIFRIDNGKIAEIWQSYDQVTMLRQIGAMPG